MLFSWALYVNPVNPIQKLYRVDYINDFCLNSTSYIIFQEVF